MRQKISSPSRSGSQAFTTSVTSSRPRRAQSTFSCFFAPGEGGFTTVDEDTSFYIREDGVPVVVFPRYAIAAGAAGFPEFPVE